MDLFPLFSAVLATAALFSWLNHRFIKLPTTIGVMLIALVMSLGLIALNLVGVEVREPAVELLEQLRFREALLDCMLAFLLFAGALHIDLNLLLGQKRVIGVLATVGVVVTTFLVALMTWAVTAMVGLEVSFLHCLLFGALISPTDPIAVLGILKQAKAPKSLATKIAGESLFNDGIGVVVFLVMMQLAGGGGHGGDGGGMTVGDIGVLFSREVFGGVVVGLGTGWLAYLLIRSVDHYQVEVLITLALAMGGYTLAMSMHASGPLSVVVSGLLMGNTGRAIGMSAVTRERLDTFWELIDEILNVVLFVLIGLEVLVLDFSGPVLLVAVLAIPITLFARFLSVGSTVTALRRVRDFTPHAVKIMTWGGLRGGISVALALSISPDVPARDLILTVTYVVVCFSILVQGLTVKRLVGWIPRDAV
ncbi:MAG: sodium:proton antiporter [Planctomycetota bacterium]